MNIYHISLFICWRILGCFHILAILNSAAMTWECRFLFHILIFFLIHKWDCWFIQ
jgi:hypothetical protein